MFHRNNVLFCNVYFKLTTSKFQEVVFVVLTTGFAALVIISQGDTGSCGPSLITLNFVVT